MSTPNLAIFADFENVAGKNMLLGGFDDAAVAGFVEVGAHRDRRAGGTVRIGAAARRWWIGLEGFEACKKLEPRLG